MKRWAALCLAMAGVACSTAPPLPAPAFSGRLALQVDGPSAGDPSRRMTSAFELRGDADRGALDLVSPLGSVLAQARWEPGSARLDSAQGTQTFASLADLSAAALGEALPLEALFDWLRGRPWARAAHTLRLDGFEQLGWTIDLSAIGQGRLLARRPAAPRVQLRIALDPDH